MLARRLSARCHIVAVVIFMFFRFAFANRLHSVFRHTAVGRFSLVHAVLHRLFSIAGIVGGGRCILCNYLSAQRYA